MTAECNVQRSAESTSRGSHDGGGSKSRSKLPLAIMSKHRLSPAPLPPPKRLHAAGGSHIISLPGITFESALYDELILCIFSHLSWVDLCATQSTSRNWARLAADNELWRDLYLKVYGRPRLRGARGFIGRTDGREVRALPGRAKTEDHKDWKWMFRISSNWRTGRQALADVMLNAIYIMSRPMFCSILWRWSSLLPSAPSRGRHAYIVGRTNHRSGVVQTIYGMRNSSTWCCGDQVHFTMLIFTSWNTHKSHRTMSRPVFPCIRRRETGCIPFHRRVHDIPHQSQPSCLFHPQSHVCPLKHCTDFAISFFRNQRSLSSPTPNYPVRELFSIHIRCVLWCRSHPNPYLLLILPPCVACPINANFINIQASYRIWHPCISPALVCRRNRTSHCRTRTHYHAFIDARS